MTSRRHACAAASARSRVRLASTSVPTPSPRRWRAALTPVAPAPRTSTRDSIERAWLPRRAGRRPRPPRARQRRSSFRRAPCRPVLQGGDDHDRAGRGRRWWPVRAPIGSGRESRPRPAPAIRGPSRRGTDAEPRRVHEATGDSSRDRRPAGIELRARPARERAPRRPAPARASRSPCGCRWTSRNASISASRERGVQGGERIGRQRDASQAVEAEGPMAEGESAQGGHAAEVGHGAEVRLGWHGGAHALVRAAGALRHEATYAGYAPSPSRTIRKTTDGVSVELREWGRGR